MQMASDDIELQVSPEEDAIDIEAVWQGIPVGHAYAEIKDGARLVLCDFLVEDRIQVPYPFTNNLLFGIRIPCRTRNFRKRGVGRLLMDRLISEARSAGIRERWTSAK